MDAEDSTSEVAESTVLQKDMASEAMDLELETTTTSDSSVSTLPRSDEDTNGTTAVLTRSDKDPNDKLSPDVRTTGDPDNAFVTDTRSGENPNNKLSPHVGTTVDSDNALATYTRNGEASNNTVVDDAVHSVNSEDINSTMPDVRRNGNVSNVAISSPIGHGEDNIITVASNTTCDQELNNTNIEKTDLGQDINEKVAIEIAKDATPTEAEQHCLEIHESDNTNGDDSSQRTEDSEHNACKVGLICDRDTRLVTNDELTSAKEQLTDLENDIGSSNVLISEKVNMVRTFKDKAKKDVTAFREEINAFLDKMEERILNEAQTIEDECVRKLEALYDETARLTTMVNAIRKEIENFESHTGITNLPMIDVNKAHKDINIIRTGYRLVNERARVAKFVFRPGRAFEDLFHREQALGELSLIEEKDTVGANLIEDMNVTKLSWRESYYSTTSFTGIELLPSDTLVITGWSGYTVFLVDVASSAVLSRLELSSQPWDVASIVNSDQMPLASSSERITTTNDVASVNNDRAQLASSPGRVTTTNDATSVKSDQIPDTSSSGRITATVVAVTLPDEEAIQCLTVTDGTLNMDRRIKVAGKCHGIACTGDAFVVTLPGQIAVIDLQGVALKTFTHGACGAKLSYEALRIALDSERRSVYVCDNQRSTVTRLSLENGEVMGFYMNGNLVRPAGLVVDKYGHVIVCGRKSNSVHCLTPYLTEGWGILGAEDDVIGPRCLAYCPRTHSLYLGREYPVDKKIKVFKLH